MEIGSYLVSFTSQRGIQTGIPLLNFALVHVDWSLIRRPSIPVRGVSAVGIRFAARPQPVASKHIPRVKELGEGLEHTSLLGNG